MNNAVPVVHQPFLAVPLPTACAADEPALSAVLEGFGQSLFGHQLRRLLAQAALASGPLPVFPQVGLPGESHPACFADPRPQVEMDRVIVLLDVGRISETLAAIRTLVAALSQVHFLDVVADLGQRGIPITFNHV